MRFRLDMDKRSRATGTPQYPMTMAVSPRLDGVNWGYENSLQVYPVADWEHETFLDWAQNTLTRVPFQSICRSRKQKVKVSRSQLLDLSCQCEVENRAAVEGDTSNSS